MWMAGVLGPSSLLFPGHEQGPGSELEQEGHEPVSIWDTYVQGNELALQTTTLAPAAEVLILRFKNKEQKRANVFPCVFYKKETRKR